METFKLLQCIIMAPVIFTDHSKAIFHGRCKVAVPAPFHEKYKDCLYHFPYGVPNQVWYMIVLIPDLCLLPNFEMSLRLQQVISAVQTP